MPDSQLPKRNNLKIVKEYFGASSAELIALKKAESDALRQLAEGIENGTYNY